MHSDKLRVEEGRSETREKGEGDGGGELVAGCWRERAELLLTAERENYFFREKTNDHASEARRLSERLCELDARAASGA